MHILLVAAVALSAALLPGRVHSGECDHTRLAKQYAGMLEEDQALRGRYIEILEREHKKRPVDAAEKERIENTILATDEKNQRELDRLIERCGWPGKLDKKRAARSAFFIIQHAELPYQLRYLPVIKAANRRGEISNEYMAWMVDRILVRQGKPQKYGTDSDFGSGKISPVEDSKNLNRRRREIGLPRLPGFD
ncbi:hypothetical protein G4G28_22315 [Massilia sp. Dwa41.01b]|uniref:DUF6624 domain-containing protein n=1 Tax=unclassified Massilia TaxID=2609279 RepID=UPI0016048922|nr:MULTISPECIES: DUF6624 domain-containing protein [unclassified Massilia]QNA90550.1 hypothetical protein G4G28_22315 [Massilia sp. Dwa41.01b]QNA97781.1 hypothetical protein G4G31_01395 [Massilia sp. Se16.2.3]